MFFLVQKKEKSSDSVKTFRNFSLIFWWLRWEPPERKNTPKKRKYYETGFRLDRKEKEVLRAKGFYVYSRRDNGKESTIEPNVAVDFMGTLVTNFPIPFRKRRPTAYVICQGDSYLNS